jgi:hypothetical protein
MLFCSVGAMSMSIAISKILLNFIAFGIFLRSVDASFRSNHEIISRDIRMIENEEEKKVETNCLNRIDCVFISLFRL